MGGVKGYVRNGCSFSSEGNLCGSLLSLDRAVQNTVLFANIALPEAFQTTTINPASELGIFSMTGNLEEGKKADIIMLDRDLNVVSTFVEGVRVYQRGGNLDEYCG